MTVYVYVCVCDYDVYNYTRHLCRIRAHPRSIRLGPNPKLTLTDPNPKWIDRKLGGPEFDTSPLYYRIDIDIVIAQPAVYKIDLQALVIVIVIVSHICPRYS